MSVASYEDELDEMQRKYEGAVKEANDAAAKLKLLKRVRVDPV